MPAKVCAGCGIRSSNTRCPACARSLETRRQGRQWYRVVYNDPRYRTLRRRILARDSHRCTYIDPDGVACTAPAVEVHHIVPISSATSIPHALQLGLDPTNCASVCHSHNPRGGRSTPRRSA